MQLELAGVTLDLRATRASNKHDKELFRRSHTPKLVFRIHHEEGSNYTLILLNTGGGEAIDVVFKARYMEKGRRSVVGSEVGSNFFPPKLRESLLGRERPTAEVNFPETLSNQFWLYAQCTDALEQEHCVHIWGVNNGMFADPEMDGQVLDEPIYRM